MAKSSPEKLAQALRANLRRRKPSPGPQDAPAPPSDSPPEKPRALEA